MIKAAAQHLLAIMLACAVSPLAPSAARGGPPVNASAPWAWQSCRGCNVLLISIDTLRADHLGCYGYRSRTSPHLDRLAARGLVFERAYSSSYVTADSHMSVFTSLHPSVHGVQNVKKAERGAMRLREGITTLPEVLSRHGYRTAAVTGGGNIDARYGFDRGVQRYRSPSGAHGAFAQVKRFLRERHDQPFFFFFHTYHAHDPYTPADASAKLFSRGYRGAIEHDLHRLGRFRVDDSFADARRVFWSFVDKEDPADVAQLVALYDAEIREVDWQVGALIRMFRRRAPNTLVVVISDHGEQFGEHGGFLHNDLYEELIHVPLLIDHPRSRLRRRFAPRVSLIDLAPTVLDLLEVPAPAQFQGSSLRAVVTGAEPPRDIFAEKVGRTAALIRGQHKAMLWLDASGKPKRVATYDLAADPKELAPLPEPAASGLQRTLLDVLEHNRRRARLQQELGDSASAPLDAEMEDQLRALGYLE